MAKKICIIEDEKALLEMYKLKFQAEGYEVCGAGDGTEGLKVITANQPDLVLLDLIMPKMDGFEVLKKLRANDATKNLQVYVFSNLGQSSEIDKGMDLGANGYFIKSSMTPTELAKKVKTILK